MGGGYYWHWRGGTWGLDSLGQKTGGSRGPNSSRSSICTFWMGKGTAGAQGSGSAAEEEQCVSSSLPALMHLSLGAFTGHYTWFALLKQPMWHTQ